RDRTLTGVQTCALPIYDALAPQILDAAERHQRRNIISAVRLHRVGAGLVEEGPMLDRIDPCESRAENAARAVRMRGDLESARMQIGRASGRKERRQGER